MMEEKDDLNAFLKKIDDVGMFFNLLDSAHVVQNFNFFSEQSAKVQRWQTF